MSEPIVSSSACVSSTAAASSLQTDLLIVPVFGAGDALDDLPGIDAAVGGELARARTSGEFKAKLYESFLARVTGDGWAAARVLFLGAGTASDADAVRLRRVAAAASHLARRLLVTRAAFVVRGGGAPRAAAEAAADGLQAAVFHTGGHKQVEPPAPWDWHRLVVAAPGADAAEIEAAVERGAIVGTAANFSRSLVNEPGNLLPPAAFAERITPILEQAGLKVEVLDEQQIEALGFRLLLCVSRGSVQPPRVVVIRHEPAAASSDAVLGLIGKGVTFDTGGISLKPPTDMDRMKGDMAGGAAVAGAMLAIARLGGPHRVTAIIPMVENMPDGNATRPGDVVAGASGRTVEIINTDAEGRLILADALWYARQLGATHLVDVATLTGACVVALGHSMAGLFGNDDHWVDTVRAAAQEAGDRVWHLPIYEEADEQLRSEIADLVNAAGRWGGAVTAAAFLRAFAGDGPWAHLDIAGTSWSEKREPYQPKGPTGAAVRTLTALGVAGVRSDRV